MRLFHQPFIFYSDQIKYSDRQFKYRVLDLTEKEIEAVLAHEIGHDEDSIGPFNISIYLLGFQTISTLLSLGISIKKRNPVYLGPGVILTTQFCNYLLRQGEYKADAYVKENYPELTDHLISFLDKCSVRRRWKSTISQVIFGSSHPLEEERIQVLK